MKFRRPHASASLPELNLVPMIDVLMSVLTFFIIISMTLNKQKTIEVQLPQAQPEEQQPIPLDPKAQFLVELNAQGQAIHNQNSLSPEQVQGQVQQYLQQHPQGVVLLKANAELSYETVIHQLERLRALGRDRVSLVIE